MIKHLQEEVDKYRQMAAAEGGASDVGCEGASGKKFRHKQIETKRLEKVYFWRRHFKTSSRAAIYPHVPRAAGDAAPRPLTKFSKERSMWRFGQHVRLARRMLIAIGDTMIFIVFRDHFVDVLPPQKDIFKQLRVLAKSTFLQECRKEVV